MTYGRPHTTVLMPAYRAEATVREAVESALAQTVGDLELIVVDDGSPCPGVGRARRPLATSACASSGAPATGGPAAARNTALEARDRARSSHSSTATTRGSPTTSSTCSHGWRDPGHRARVCERRDPRPPRRAPHVHLRPGATPDRPLPEDRRAEPGAAAHGHGADAGGAGRRGLCPLAPQHAGLPPLVPARRRRWRFAFVDRKLARYRWPGENASLGSDRRAVELDELRMWIGFMLRHPLTPGPRRQVRVRLGREVERLRFRR